MIEDLRAAKTKLTRRTGELREEMGREASLRASLEESHNTLLSRVQDMEDIVTREQEEVGDTQIIIHRAGYPRHRENRENGKKNLCQGKHREFGNFAKTQGILLAQVVNVLILKVRDIAIVATKKIHFFPEAG